MEDLKSVEIKRVTSDDIIQLQKIGRQTFYETFSEVNTAENMTKYLEERFSVEKLSAELDNNNSEFHFAVAGNQIVGYLKLNTGQAQTELKDIKALEIERIYVLKEFHGMKVGQKLLEKAIYIGRQKEVDYIWLGVWENNHRALKFYRKNGFAEFDRHIFVLGESRQTDLLMKFLLKNDQSELL